MENFITSKVLIQNSLSPNTNLNIKGDVNYPKGDITSACESEPVPCTDEWTSLMISPHDHESLFGSQVSWDKTDQGEVILAVAAERSSLGSRLGGAVYFYTFS